VPPVISIVIPSHDRPVELARCLEALARGAYPSTHTDIVVVDDGSVSPLEPVIAPFHGRLTVRVIRQANAGPAAARNAGAAVARGDLLAFTDDDCLPDERWLERLAARFAANPHAMIGGRTVNALPANPFASMSQAIIDTLYRHYNRDPARAQFFASNNLAIPAAHFRDIGGFAPGFRVSEDRELCDRWLAAGREMVFEPGAVVAHAHDLTARSFWRQHFSYGRGAYRFQASRSRRDAGGMRRDMRFHADVRNWLGYPFSRMPGHSASRVAALILMWQVANAAGYFSEAWRTWGAANGEGRP
jgi:GT2 family glycosyltransferase